MTDAAAFGVVENVGKSFGAASRGAEPVVAAKPVVVSTPREPEEPTDIAVVEDDEGQMAIDLTAHGDWKLPAREILKRSVEKEVDARSAAQVTIRAVLINILNPKLSIFFLAFLPQFVSAGDVHPLSHMLELSGVFMAMTFVVFVGYGLFAAAVRDHVISRPRVLTWMRRTFAAAFVALGAKLALADR